MDHTSRNYDMNDYNNAKKYDYDLQDMIELSKIRHKITDPKWQNYRLNYKKPKKSKPKIKKPENKPNMANKSSNINLGKHETHDWQPMKGPFGPHAGKIICKTCNDKWVAWLAKGTI